MIGGRVDKGNPIKYPMMFAGYECTEQEYSACKLRWGDSFNPPSADIEQYLNQLRKDYTPSRANEASVVKHAHVEPQVASSVEATLAQRGSRYGDFSDHARVCQRLKDVMIMEIPASTGKGWEHLSDVQKQALEVIADKIARILTGDPNYDDNWHDIQGYAKLVEDRLPKQGSK